VRGKGGEGREQDGRKGEGKGEDEGKRGEMTQTMYARMNKIKILKKYEFQIAYEKGSTYI
jgi:hypothetical protein